MTVIGRDRYSEEMDPHLRYRLAPCHGCGAGNEHEAGRVCRPVSDQNGEYSCPGSEGYNPFGTKWDLLGRACRLTNKSAKAEAAAIAEYVDHMIAQDEKRMEGGSGR